MNPYPGYGASQSQIPSQGYQQPTTGYEPNALAPQTTGYEPNALAPPTAPPGLGPDAALDWYLTQHRQQTQPATASTQQHRLHCHCKTFSLHNPLCYRRLECKALCSQSKTCEFHRVPICCTVFKLRHLSQPCLVVTRTQVRAPIQVGSRQSLDTDARLWHRRRRK